MHPPFAFTRWTRLAREMHLPGRSRRDAPAGMTSEKRFVSRTPRVRWPL